MKRFIKKDGGFTLIELLVVILIIAILIAVSAPSFLGQTKKAQDSAAEQYLTIAYKDAFAGTITLAAQGEYVSTAQAAQDIASSEPELTAETTGTSTGPRDIVVSVNTGTNTLSLSSVSDSGNSCSLTAVGSELTSAASCS